jgi:hypothetical protein
MSRLAFTCAFKGGAFHPLEKHHNEIAAQFGEGEIVTLEEVEERSLKSHNQLFAIINQAWATLLEGEDDRWPSPLHFRKWVTIKAGYCDVRTVVCASNAEAIRWKPVIAGVDPYAIVAIRGATVTIYTANSLAWSKMKRAEFQAVKDKMLGVVDGLLGVPLGSTERAAA